jgi:hypothetical protein
MPQTADFVKIDVGHVLFEEEMIIDCILATECQKKILLLVDAHILIDP